VLPRRPAPKIISRNEERYPLELGSVKNELGVFAPFGKKPVLKACSGNSLQKIRGDNLVGVDVGLRERRSSACVLSECLHTTAP
jgi:hypothetical protein